MEVMTTMTMCLFPLYDDSFLHNHNNKYNNICGEREESKHTRKKELERGVSERQGIYEDPKLQMCLYRYILLYIYILMSCSNNNNN